MLPLFTQVEKASNLLDPENFSSNQKNKLTVSQQQRIDTISWARLKLLLFEVSVLGIILAVPFLVVVPLLLEGTQASKWVLPFFVILFLIIFLVIVYNIVHEVIWNLRLKRDHDNLAIRQGKGQLSYDNKGYSFELDNGFRLHLPADESNGLLPGVIYEMFYLEESGFCLAADEAHRATPSQVQNTLNEILCTVNGFSREDLIANHNGQVTFSQRMKPFTKVLTGAMIILPFMLFLSLPFITWLSFPHDFTLSTTGIGWIVVILIAVFLSGGAAMVLTGLIDTVFSNLKQMQGNVYKTIRTTTNWLSRSRSQVTRYYYEIDDRRFEVNKRAYTALINGLEYRIYYLPHTNQLISIENLSTKTNPFLF